MNFCTEWKPFTSCGRMALGREDAGTGRCWDGRVLGREGAGTGGHWNERVLGREGAGTGGRWDRRALGWEGGRGSPGVTHY